MKKAIVFGLEQLDEVAQQLVLLLQPCHIITFKGDLGTGKTTLIKALLKAYGVTDVVTSPTFTYMSCYARYFYHFDLYRLKNLEQFFLLGFEEILSLPDAKIFIEWPEIIEPLLKDKRRCAIVIDYHGAHQRIVNLDFNKCSASSHE